MFRSRAGFGYIRRMGSWRGQIRFSPPLGAALLAFLVQIAYLAEGGKDPTFNRPLVDAQTYDQQARDIAAGRPAPPIPFWQPPLYPYALALVYSLTGGSIVAAKGVQAALGAASCALAAVIASRLFGRRAGWIAGAVTAFYGPLVFFHAQLLPVSLACALDLLLLRLLIGAVDDPRPARWLGCGVVTGLSALAIPNILVVGVCVVLALAWTAVRRKQGRALASAAVFLAGAAAVLAPVTIRNYVFSRDFVLVSTNGGINLYIGNNEDAESTIAIRPGADWVYLERLPIREGARSPSAADSWFTRKVVRYAAAHPAAFARGLVRKAGLFLNARELPRNLDLYVLREFSVVLRLLLWRAGPFAFPFGVVAPLALLGLWRARGSRAGLVSAAFLVLYGLSVVLFFVTSRYRVVLAPVFAVFAAGGVVWLADRAVPSRRRLAGLAVVLAAACFVNRPVRAATDGVDFRAELPFLLGVRAAESGDEAEAVRRYEEALRLKPDYAPALNNLGALHGLAGRYAESASFYEKALAADPDYAEARSGLGFALARMGRLREAEACYEEALRLRPYLTKTMAQLGELRLREGDLPSAVAHFRRAVELEPAEYEACNYLAWIRATAPDGSVRNGAEAVALAERMYQAAPRVTPLMLDTLAAAYAEAGRFRQAEAVQRQAVRDGEAQGLREWVVDARRRLSGYAAGRPWRDTSLGAPNKTVE